MSLRTPLYDLKQFNSVYEPSEDTFLLLDALESELTYIESLKPLLIVEVGSGSGIVITSVASFFKNEALYFSSDINPCACLCTLKTASLNNVHVHCINMDLLFNFKSTFDIVIFNPPYVCTEMSEISPGINRAWAGGLDGRVIIDRFLLHLEHVLKPKGVCYMVAIKENKPYEIIEKMSCNFNACVVKKRKILGEHLFVLRLIKL
ncbi:methyltransferase N6AMT1 [Photinus pyralis]|uniref:Methyltransferase HEMK2 n=1 Tax=Photinus pyralis TaxID=7054 RepID=A0A1Y1L4K5_PHOPY|nr:methyltransferase N6AMT1 [Photinus pyralis]